MAVSINGHIVDTKTKEMQYVNEKYDELTKAISECKKGPSQQLCVLSTIVRLVDGISRNKEGALEMLDVAAAKIREPDFESANDVIEKEAAEKESIEEQNGRN